MLERLEFVGVRKMSKALLFHHLQLSDLVILIVDLATQVLENVFLVCALRLKLPLECYPLSCNITFLVLQYLNSFRQGPEGSGAHEQRQVARAAQRQHAHERPLDHSELRVSRCALAHARQVSSSCAFHLSSATVTAGKRISCT